MKKRVIARIFIKNESIAAFKRRAAEIIAKTRDEKGCLFYNLFEDVSHAGEFLFYEEYADQAALDIHFKSEYLATFRKNIGDMEVQAPVVEVI